MAVLCKRTEHRLSKQLHRAALKCFMLKYTEEIFKK